MSTTLHIARVKATDENLTTILGLIEEAAGWLRTKGTDQWQRPWPSLAERDKRVMRGLEGGKTWGVRDRDEIMGVLSGTVTIAKQANPQVWSAQVREEELTEPAVHVHRLIVARDRGDRGLGADLIDWAGQRAAREYGAKWIRIDVWTSNRELHKYYMRRGFEPVGLCADTSYPSRALFQKAVSDIDRDFRPQFIDTDAHPFT
jgi:GNAT superfamily N-acetyltransferase